MTVIADAASPLRRLTLGDAPVLARLVRANRDFLAPTSPERDDAFYTEEGQRAGVTDALERHREGTSQPHVIVDGGERVVGRITLNEIVRGPFLSCHLGYWVAEQDNGRGLATAAVRDIVRVAFDELGLHRVQAGTLVHNAASQRVLERTGFERIGLAPAYLRIAGRWQDHLLFQLLNPDQT